MACKTVESHVRARTKRRCGGFEGRGRREDMAGWSRDRRMRDGSRSGAGEGGA